MIVKAYKTHKISKEDSIYQILDDYLPRLEEGSIVAIASKIVGICEGRVVKAESPEQKEELVKKEAQYYLPRESNQYGVMITITNNIMVASAGIDESNADGNLALWPIDPQESANDIRSYLAKKLNLSRIGVVITDSRLAPLRWGVTGVAISHSGFRALNSYVGKPDIYGRLMQMEKSNVADSLAVAGVAEMGEGNEQRPLAVITDAKFVHFQKRNPTKKELEDLIIRLGEDVYSTMLTSVKWERGGKE